MAKHNLDDDCGVAQAIGVLGDAWSVIVIRDVARGRHRFEHLLAESAVSRKVLTQRLHALVADGVLTREPYQDRPTRFEYRLTARGRALLPVLASLQEWGDTWLLGDGTTAATAERGSAEAHRVADLVGTRVPELASDPITDAPLTVVYAFPGAIGGLDSIEGGRGCTLESCTYRDRLGEFEALGARVVGVSTQHPDEQGDFAAANGIQFPLVSDATLEVATALRLPTFTHRGATRLKRLTLVIDAERVVRGTLFPIRDVTGSVGDALAMVEAAAAGGQLAKTRRGEGSTPGAA